ncbi:MULTISPECIES: hypothetical protein [unclassified Streptomyces]|uniref:hypothetical protein n=1 Tax=unclassified Streptomyces TaxID=2593676 RepID=UPI00300A0EFB
MKLASGGGGRRAAGNPVGEFLQVEGVPQHPAADFESAAGKVEIGGPNRAKLFTWQRVNGYQDDDEAAERSLRLIHQSGQEIAAHGLRESFEVTDRQLAGRIPEDHPFPLERLEQAAQAHRGPLALLSGQPRNRCLNVVSRDLSQSGHAGSCPRGEDGLDVGEVTADAAVIADVAFMAALAP